MAAKKGQATSFVVVVVVIERYLDPGSGDKHPGFATLVLSACLCIVAHTQ
jgi:hypothetical protein